MPDIKSILSEEIRRLSKKEVKIAVDPLKALVTALRKTVAEQTLRIKELEKKCSLIPNKKTILVDDIKIDDKGKKLKINSAKIKKIRTKLHLSQHDFGKLVGSNFLSVSHWELGKSKPRQSAIMAILQASKLSKREAHKRIESMKATPPPVVVMSEND